MANKRVVLVNIEQGDSLLCQLQVDLSKISDFPYDHDRILFAVAEDRPELAELVTANELEVLLESSDFPGAIVSLPSSPLAHKSVVRCRIRTKNSCVNHRFVSKSSHNSSTPDISDIMDGSLTHALVTSMNANSMLIDYPNSNLVPSYIDLNNDGNLEDIVPVQPPQSPHRLRYSAEKFNTPDISAMRHSRDDSAILNNSTANKKTNKISKRNHSEQPGGKENTSLPLQNFPWRKFFNTEINNKLRHFQELTVNQENIICRSLVDDIIQFTDNLDSTSKKAFVNRMFEVYPGIVGPKFEDAQEEKAKIDALKVEWERKLSKRMSRVRSENGTQLACGRPKKQPKLDDAGVVRGPGETDTAYTQVDWTSYRENVAKMISFHKDAPTHPGLETLYNLTYSGRRNLLEKGEFIGSASAFVENECPLLGYDSFLLRELNQILYNRNTSAVSVISNTCVSDTFQRKWMEMVPKLIYLAEKQSSSKNIGAVLRHRQKYGDETIALQLLVLFLPGSTRTLNGIKYFIEIIDESENMSDAAEKMPRESPFIMRCGDSFHLIIDGKPIIHVTGNAINAFVALIATFYAFHIHWTEKIKILYLFVESHLLGQPVRPDSKQKTKIDKFLRLLSSVPGC